MLFRVSWKQLKVNAPDCTHRISDGRLMVSGKRSNGLAASSGVQRYLIWGV